MKNQINMAKSSLEPLTKETVAEIVQWDYEAPYDAYNFKGNNDEYLLGESVWGVEQFCLTCDGMILGQVACQFEGDDLWDGWSMAPEFTGQGNGATFVSRSLCPRNSKGKRSYWTDTTPCFVS